MLKFSDRLVRETIYQKKKVHKKISDEYYWSEREKHAKSAPGNDSFHLADHDYTEQSSAISEDVAQRSRSANLNPADEKALDDVPVLQVNEDNLMDLDVLMQNFVESNIMGEDVSQSFADHCEENVVASDVTDDSGIDSSCDSMIEDPTVEVEEAPAAEEQQEEMISIYDLTEESNAKTNEPTAKKRSFVAEKSLEDTESSCDSTSAKTEDPKAKVEKKPAAKIKNCVAERSSDGNESSSAKIEEAPAAKKKLAPKKNQDALISEQTSLIVGESDLLQRVTRLEAKRFAEKPPKPPIGYVPGTLVWGRFRGGWWSGIVIHANDAGMASTEGKMWISWIGEKRISELPAKCVEPFSSDLESRLKSLSAADKSKKVYRKLKEAAYLQTVQLLRRVFPDGPLTKPYTTWVASRVLPQKEKLNSLLMYPYPRSLADTLEEWKKVNLKNTEKYLREKEKEREKGEKEKDTIEERKPKGKTEKPDKILEGGIEIVDQKPGMIVWAKIEGFCWWPCVITDYQHLNKKQPKLAHNYVIWYGDYAYSEVEYRQILSFQAGMKLMESRISTSKDKLFRSGVLRACQDYGEQLDYVTDNWDLKYVAYLFCKSEHHLEPENAEVVEESDWQSLYSPTMQKQFREKVLHQRVNEERKQLILQSEKMKLILKEELPLNSVCITCLSEEDLHEHPLFDASLCKTCLEDFRPKMFAYGNDAKCFYCSLCGNDDVVAMCDNQCCPRVFCTACIKFVICPNYYAKVMLRQPWFCFLCRAKSKEVLNSVVKSRSDWQSRILNMYKDDEDPEEPIPAKLRLGKKKRKLRVLSLFDGISTGLVVLKQLGIPVGRYYASEIDPDAQRVSFYNHGHEIIQLGDVRHIDEKVIKELGPIDLLIGGSPCNDLSVANPKRRGLNDPAGTGPLFFEYVRIKKLLAEHSEGRHFFWLYENVASMPHHCQEQISQELGRKPMFLDSADFSAMHRPRLYWTNLPRGPYEKSDTVLQEMLRKKCGRQALVKKINTVTTRMNSLNQTQENLKPVVMNGKRDMLWITELEEIFGFPAHYTDVDLPKTRRLRLIGRAWDVHTLCAVLRPVFFL